jgi:hypothetical protein
VDSQDQQLWKMVKREMRVPTSSPFASALKDRPLRFRDSRNPDLQPSAGEQPSDPAVIEMVNEAMRACEYASATKPKFTSPSKVLQPINGIKVRTREPERQSEQNTETSAKPSDNLCLTQSSACNTFQQHRNTLVWYPY